MVLLRILSGKHLSRCELLKNLNIKLKSNVAGTLTWTTRVTAIGLYVLHTGELHIQVLWSCREWNGSA